MEFVMIVYDVSLKNSVDENFTDELFVKLSLAEFKKFSTIRDTRNKDGFIYWPAGICCGIF